MSLVSVKELNNARSYSDLSVIEQLDIFYKIKILINNFDIDLILHTEYINTLNKYNNSINNNITISGKLKLKNINKFEEFKKIILNIINDIHFKISYEDNEIKMDDTNTILPSSPSLSSTTALDESTNLNLKTSQLSNLVDIVSNFLHNNLLEFLNITITVTNFYTSLKEYTTHNISIKGVIPSIYESQFTHFSKLISPYLLPNINTKFQIYQYEVGPIPLISQTCTNCSNVMPFYVCIKCSEINPTAFCDDCYEDHEKSNGNHLFLKLHSLATNLNSLIYTNNTGRINYIPVDSDFNCFCDGCGDIITECRWKCANCPDFDLCDSCFERWEESKGTFYPAIKAPSACLTPAERNSIILPEESTVPGIKSIFVKTCSHPRGHCFLFMKKNYAFSQVDKKE